MTKGPCPFHRATPKDGPSIARCVPAEWSAPRYPGDSVMTVMLTDGDDIGDVRVQEYEPGRLKVGSFLPGEVECSPGDTPKVWPERSEWVADRPAAAKVLGRYLIDAFRAGWRLYTI